MAISSEQRERLVELGEPEVRSLLRSEGFSPSLQGAALEWVAELSEEARKRAEEARKHAEERQAEETQRSKNMLRAAWIGVFVAIVAIGVAIWQGIDAKASNEKLIDAINQRNSAQAEANKSLADNAALESISIPGFLKQYDAHVAALQTAADVYETVKMGKRINPAISDAASELAQAESDLYAATDKFTDFVDLWRKVRDVFDKMLDGNVTQLENSRRENNTVDVLAMAQRVVRSAPDLATPLRAAMDALIAASKK